MAAGRAVASAATAGWCVTKTQSTPRREVFERRVGDGRAVVRRRAAPELIEQQQRARTEPPQRLGRLAQLVLEGGASAAQLVRRTHACEERAHGRERARIGGHIRAQLRQ